jgi:hypothetical protein
VVTAVMEPAVVVQIWGGNGRYPASSSDSDKSWGRSLSKSAAMGHEVVTAVTDVVAVVWIDRGMWGRK